MTYPEWLLRRCRAELKRNGVLSTSLALELAGAGFDVPAVEQQTLAELAGESTEEEEIL